jgi:hypothetical protein
LVQFGGIGSHLENKNFSFNSGVSYNKGKVPRAASRSRFGETVTAAKAAGAAVKRSLAKTLRPQTFTPPPPTLAELLIRF